MKRIDWLQFIILPGAIAVMVVAWVAPWTQWIVLSTGVDRPGMAPPAGLMAELAVTNVLPFNSSAPATLPPRGCH